MPRKPFIGTLRRSTYYHHHSSELEGSRMSLRFQEEIVWNSKSYPYRGAVISFLLILSKKYKSECSGIIEFLLEFHFNDQVGRNCYILLFIARSM
jgi:hypothetical protein